MRTTLLICILFLACGCASQPKPPSPQIQQEVQSRLNGYSTAWFAGDATGVSNSFVQRSAEEREFAQALGKLAAAEKTLLKEQHAVPESIAATVQMSEREPMVALNRPWHSYAYAASRPPQAMVTKDDGVIVQMISSGEYTLFVRNVAGRWLIEPYGWAMDRPVTVLTDSIHRQTVLTNNSIEAIRAQDWNRLRGVIQQMNQQRMVDRISDSTNLTVP